MKRLFCAAAAAVLLVLGISAPAAAGGDSTLPSGSMSLMAGPCGSSYSHIGHYAISSSAGTLGYLDVYWSNSANRNCLVTNHSGKTYGDSMYTQARIRPSGWSWPSCPRSTGCDAGHFSYYAGPVYTPAGVNMTNRCIDITGAVDWAQRTLTRIHCG